MLRKLKTYKLAQLINKFPEYYVLRPTLRQKPETSQKCSGLVVHVIIATDYLFKVLAALICLFLCKFFDTISCNDVSVFFNT